MEPGQSWAVVFKQNLTKSMENYYINEKRKILYNEFNKITGWFFNDYPFGFDVIGLDNLLQQNEKYNHKKSCADNIEKIHGKRCRDIVDNLLKQNE